MSVKELAGLQNLGKTSAGMLAEIGIDSPESLRQAGAALAWYRLRFRFGRRITKNYLWAIDGALSGINCLHLPPERKTALLGEVERLGRGESV